MRGSLRGRDFTERDRGKRRGVMKKRCHGGKRRHGDFTEDRNRGGLTVLGDFPDERGRGGEE